MAIFESLHQFVLRLASYTWWEVALEFILIWTVVYVVWRFLRGTRGAGAIRGLLLIVLFTLALRLVIPNQLLQRLAFLYDNVLGFAALALVIIFQPELRRGVIRLGETTFFRSEPSETKATVDAIVAACSFLSRSKFGALIALERQIGFRETVEGGRPLNADVSPELLESIFWPSNPLHDMGVVIRNGRIAAAGVQFPLAEPDEMPSGNLGTRHRAAVGLSRVSDAVVVVVSEETGAISIALRGRLQRWLTEAQLRAELQRLLTMTDEADETPDSEPPEPHRPDTRSIIARRPTRSEPASPGSSTRPPSAVASEGGRTP